MIATSRRGRMLALAMGLALAGTGAAMVPARAQDSTQDSIFRRERGGGPLALPDQASPITAAGPGDNTFAHQRVGAPLFQGPALQLDGAVGQGGQAATQH